jgi:Protein of unknown function (DUF2568)
LALRFLLELVALAALAYWGATTATSRGMRILWAVAAPAVAAFAWFLFVAPNAAVDAGPVVRLLVELLVFGAATAALLARGRPVLAVLVVLLYIANWVLMSVWEQ